MMNSAEFQVEDESDDFAPNPFRSGSSGGATSNSGSAAPSWAASANQQQQPQMQQHQVQQQVYPPPLQQQQQQQQQPDPVTGMTGSIAYPINPMQQQPQQQQQFLSGPMDQNNSQRNVTGNYGGDQIQSTPTGFRFCGWNTITSCCRLESYATYFNMDTSDILARLRSSLLKFWQPDQFRTGVVGDVPDDPSVGPVHLKGPDLYGPTWLSMTLIFLIAVTSNMSAYYHHLHVQRKQAKQHSSADSNSTDAAGETDNFETEVEEFEYDLNHLIRAGSIVFVFAAVAPTLFWLGTTCLGMPNISWAMWMCCYGYAQAPIMIAVLLAWINIEIFVWLVLAAGIGCSLLLILRNLSTPLLSQDTGKAMPVIFSIMGTHVCYLLILKFMFYK